MEKIYISQKATVFYYGVFYFSQLKLIFTLTLKLMRTVVIADEKQWK